MGKKKPFLLITGMHRTGTSFLVRALNLAGMYIGGWESMISTELDFKKDNLRGHWENKKLLELGEKTLTVSNGKWHEPPEKISLNDELRDEIKKSIKELTERPSFASGYKDPRILLYFESWKEFFPENFLIVGIYRDPLKVAESLKKRDNFNYEKSIQLWKIYNQNLLNLLKKYPGFLLDFDWPKEKLIEEVKLVADKVGLVKNIDLSQWFSKELLFSNKTYQISHNNFSSSIRQNEQSFVLQFSHFFLLLLLILLLSFTINFFLICCDIIRLLGRCF